MIPAALLRENCGVLRAVAGAAAPLSVAGVCRDSRRVVSGGCFVAIPGTRMDGHDYIAAAISGGAKLVLHSRELPEYRPDVAYWRVDDAFSAYFEICRAVAGFPDRRLRLFGVTGTNGKTTTVYLWRHLLDCGMISTVEMWDGRECVPSDHTTPDPETLFDALSRMERNGLAAAAMELSSHALDQRRCGSLRFRVAVFTNLTGDHLDYHRTMENYYLAKKRLFTEMLLPDGVAVINFDDAYGRRLAGELTGAVRVVTFGEAPGADYRLIPGESPSDFSLINGNFSEHFDSNLIGEHNFHNLSGAILGALDCGLSVSEIRRRLASGVSVPGRLQEVFPAPGVAAYVDYAHTDDALRNVLAILRKLTRGRLIVVFGAGGDRDHTKRPRMGRAVAELADLAIVTSDNPRSENPDRIIADILAGVPETARGKFRVEPDRARALALAVELARPGDVLLAAGKGHEKTQEIAGVKHPFDDVEELRKLTR